MELMEFKEARVIIISIKMLNRLNVINLDINAHTDQELVMEIEIANYFMHQKP